MGLRIKTNVASDIVQKNLRKASGNIESSFNKLSSGKRITSASDDPAGLATSSNFEAQVRSLRQATRNANDGISLIQSTESSLSEASNIIVRLRELSMSSASDTIDDTQRKLLNKEYSQLLSEIDRISESTYFNGIKVLGEDHVEVLDFQVGTGSGRKDIVSLDASGIDSSINSIGIDGTSISNKEDAVDSLEAIDKAIEYVSRQKVELGSVQSRLQSTVSNLEVQTINQESALSYVQDVDIASEVASLAANRVLNDAGIASLAQANNIPNNALRLIS